MNSEIAKGLRERIAKVIGADEPFAWARRAGISSATFDRIWNGGQVPKAVTLLKIAKAGGVSVDWLLTGEAPTASEPVASHSSRFSFDEELHALVVDGILQVYKEEGARLPPRDLGRLAARLHADLVAAYDTPEERRVGLKALLQQLRRQLQKPPAPGADDDDAENGRSACGSQ